MVLSSSGLSRLPFFSKEHSSRFFHLFGEYPVSAGRLVSLAKVSDKSLLLAMAFHWPKCLPDGDEDVFSRTLRQ